MKGDFTRLTYRREKHFSRVLRQQGRVTLDADDNEQTAILLHYLRTLARDLIGPYAAPSSSEGGFLLSQNADGELHLSKGRYYVDGILVENEADPLAVDSGLLSSLEDAGGMAWLYLDVWERHITSIEDDAIREAALGGPDTCTRAQVTWQVRAIAIPREFDDRITWLKGLARQGIPEEIALLQKERDEIVGELDKIKSSSPKERPGDLCGQPGLLLNGLSHANLAARVDPGVEPEDACVLPPDAKYRGMENQLYRVEIHNSGRMGDDSGATFKWSRDNGSIATAWLGTDGNDLEVERGRGFAAGNWVELSHDGLELAGDPGVLVKLAKVEGNRLSIDQASIPKSGMLVWTDKLPHPKVRRWDQVQRDDLILDDDGAVAVQESPLGAAWDGMTWLDLEDGIQVAFIAGGEYRSGDYWLVPARVATGKIEWPDRKALPPRGIHHHYAPLGFIWWDGGKIAVRSCGCVFQPGTSCTTGLNMRPPPQAIDLRSAAKPASAVRAAPSPAPASKPRRVRKPH